MTHKIWPHGGRSLPACMRRPPGKHSCEFWCLLGVCDAALRVCDIVWYDVYGRSCLSCVPFCVCLERWAKCRNTPFGVLAFFLVNCLQFLRFGGGSHGGEAFEFLGTMVPQNVSSKGGAAHGPRHPSCFWLFFLNLFSVGIRNLVIMFSECLSGFFWGIKSMKWTCRPLDLCPCLFGCLLRFCFLSLSVPGRGEGIVAMTVYDDFDVTQERTRSWYDFFFSVWLFQVLGKRKFLQCQVGWEFFLP